MSRRELPAATLAFIAAGLLMVLIYVGSRRLEDFDSALIGYAVATIVAFAALVYRYTRWITRPPTWRYFQAGWANFLSWTNFRRYTTLIPVAWWTDILGQTFILKRSFQRWLMHMSIFWGVILSLAITLPLTFGWIRFTLVPPDAYQLWFFGIPVFRFPIEAGTGFALYHALDFAALLLILGIAIALWRRTTDAGLLVTQRFGFDLVPLLLLLTIAVTGLALTASSLWWEGRFYWFISLSHQLVVVAWLLSIPFGKFFHIIERPATVGVTLYQVVNQDIEHYGRQVQTGRCPRCGEELPSPQFISDLEATLVDLGQEYTLGDKLGTLQDYCPTCKRVMRGQAYYRLMGRRFL
ncbi:MAG: hypothetical protein M5U01_11000 [Ardenticatenaceae bacterium]|nr:hypothetical protein [Ardenticatenaceae bacterium]